MGTAVLLSGTASLDLAEQSDVPGPSDVVAVVRVGEENTLLLQLNGGTLAVTDELMLPLLADREVVSHYLSVNADSEFIWWSNGERVAHVDERTNKSKQRNHLACAGFRGRWDSAGARRPQRSFGRKEGRPSLLLRFWRWGPSRAAEPFCGLSAPLLWLSRLYCSFSSVSVIDTSTNTVTATLTVGSLPSSVAIAPNGQRTYVTSEGGSSVSVIDISTNTVASTIAVGSGPFGIAITSNGERAYVTNVGDGD